MRKEWTTGEQVIAEKMYKDGKNIEEIADELDRSHYSIESKLRKMGVMVSKNSGKSVKSGNIWREKDLEELKLLIDSGYTVKQLAERFGRSETAITIKVSRLGKQIKKPNRTWKEEDEEQFKEDWLDPELSIHMLENKYNRTWFGLRKRAQILGLGPRRYNDQYLSINTICEEMNVSADRVSSWIKKGLKAKKNRSGKVKKVIDQEDLLEFLEQHQDLFSADKISEYLFYKEPQWLIDKRKRDGLINKDKNRLPYTNEEDKRIQQMFKMGKSDDEIAIALKRTRSGILCRRMILGLTKREYMPYEIDILKKYSRYKTVYELAKMLPLRTPKGIEYECRKLGIPYHISKNMCDKM